MRNSSVSIKRDKEYHDAFRCRMFTKPIIGALWAAALLWPAQTTALKTPEFKLSDLNGKLFKSAELKGSVVLLDLWATWCEPCIADIPMLNRLHEKFADRGLKVIGIAVQSGRTNDIKPHVAKLGIKYRVLVGTDRTVEQYVPVGFPVRYLIGKYARIAKKYLGSLPDREKEQQTEMERDIESLLQHERLRMQAR